MDPTACLERAESALRDKDYEEATAALLDLAYWLARGGFKPPGYLGALERIIVAL